MAVPFSTWASASTWESSLEHQGCSMVGPQDTTSSPHQSPPLSRPPGFLVTLSQTEPGSSATLWGQTGWMEAHWPRHPLYIHAVQTPAPFLPCTMATVATVTPEGRGLSMGIQKKTTFLWWIPPVLSVPAQRLARPWTPTRPAIKTVNAKPIPSLQCAGRTASPTCLPALLAATARYCWFSDGMGRGRGAQTARGA